LQHTLGFGEIGLCGCDARARAANIGLSQSWLKHRQDLAAPNTLAFLYTYFDQTTRYFGGHSGLPAGDHVT
jgi:hypothetical protein